MGEYAKLGNERIKIGTCESMYYLRYEDRGRVTKESDSLDPTTETGLFWRLPFPDEDECGPGGYTDYSRGYRLVGFSDDSTLESTGTIQLRHDCGLLINVKCYHGIKLPGGSDDIQPHWNGKDGHCFEIAHIKNLHDGSLKPVVRCRHCSRMWRYEWADVLPYVKDPEMKSRLEMYQ